MPILISNTSIAYHACCLYRQLVLLGCRIVFQHAHGSSPTIGRWAKEPVAPVEQLSLRRGNAALSQTEFDRSLGLAVGISFTPSFQLGSATFLPTAWTRYALSPSLGSHSQSARQQAFFLAFSRTLDAFSTRFVRRLFGSYSVGLSQRVGFVTLFAVVHIAPGSDALSIILP